MRVSDVILHKPEWLKNRWLLAGSVFYVAMFVLGSIPTIERTFISTFNDKLMHFAAYSILTVLVYLGLRTQIIGEFFLPRILWCFAIVLGMGALDEIAQYFVGRDPSFDGWLSDSAASVLILMFIITGHLLLLGRHYYRPSDEPNQD